MKYIVICLSRCEGESDNYRISYRGVDTFDTLVLAEEAQWNDMKEYLEAENEETTRAKIVGNRIEWLDEETNYEREAKWYIYEV